MKGLGSVDGVFRGERGREVCVRVCLDGDGACVVEADGAFLLDTQSINVLLTPQRNYSNVSPSTTTTDTPSSYLRVSNSLTSQNNHIKVTIQA